MINSRLNPRKIRERREEDVRLYTVTGESSPGTSDVHVYRKLGYGDTCFLCLFRS